MKCEFCIFCISSDLNVYKINCEKFGNTGNKCYCKYYTSQKDYNIYKTVKEKLDNKGE